MYSCQVYFSLYYFILFLAFILASNGYEHCVTENDKKGACVNMNQCSLEKELTKLPKEQLPKSIDRMKCQKDSNNTLVCCPIENLEDILPSSPQCGRNSFHNVLEDRIIGGEESELGQWPWLVALGYTKDLSDGEVFIAGCGGSLISSKFILTAAHCYDFPIFMARMGVINLQPGKNDPIPYDIPVEEFILHEHYFDEDGYPALEQYNDIGLIKLNHNIEFTDLIRPICLPERDWSTKEFEGDVFVAGWGVTEYDGEVSNVQLEVQVPIITRNICKDIFLSKKDARILEIQICAGSLKGDKDSCQGDSGGPLMYYEENDESYYAIGIVSFGYKCASAGYPGVYTRVAKYIDWIKDTIISSQ